MRQVGFFSTLLMLLLLASVPSSSVAESSATTEASVSSSTPPASSSTAPVSSSTAPVSSSTAPISSSEPPASSSTAEPTSPPTTSSPLNLYRLTEEELKKITEILDLFLKLLDTAANERHVQGVRSGHPGSWWHRGAVLLPRETDYDFCEEGFPSDSLCGQLQTDLRKTDELVIKLEENVDEWRENDLEDLQSNRKSLNSTYTKADEDTDYFNEQVDQEKFENVIDELKTNVEESTSVVQEKIAELESPDDPGSVALVAVLGTLGGLMIVALVGVIVYKFVKKPKTTSGTSDMSYDKLEGENIPIGRLSQEGQGSRQTSRVDPYSQAPAPGLRSEPVYAAPYGSRSESGYGARSESGYGGQASSNTGRVLPRAHI